MNLGFLREAVREGLNQMVPGPEKDDDLDIYEKLQPSDFPKLIEKYGEESVMSYIKHMEARKIRKGAE